MNHEILNGDCLEVMKTFPDNHFTGIVTDPPYGLHFMGKDWDSCIASVPYWEEMLRIVKPGGHLLSFGAPRLYHRMACMIEDPGWEIRDCLMWIFGSGFPKSHNHFGFEGYGTALKPAYEPIIMAMKPLDGTFKQNAEKWGQAGINIDGCRIPINSKDDIHSKNPHTQNKGENNIYGLHKGSSYEVPKGRWPANLILDEEAAKMLDEQSGILKTGSMNPQLHRKKNSIYSKFSTASPNGQIGSTGGASRFFYCAKASSRERNEGLEGLPSKAQTTYGEMKGTETHSENRQSLVKNIHPTVKPLALMRYLITLIAPPTNALILDPFAGSGSTIVAAKQLGISAIGIEKQPEYAEIARKRVENVWL